MENLTVIATRIIWTGFILLTINIILLLITWVFVKPGELEYRIIDISKKLLYIGLDILAIGIIILIWINHH